MRRYDLDWIRISVFALLILYHIGMFFVSWGWHIKNHTIYTWAEIPMLFVNQWRLPILFLVSGMGTRFALSRRSIAQFLIERHNRLLIPLVFGMIVIVAPQVYIERIVSGQFDGSFFDFYPFYFEGAYPEGNFSWHHLWFLPYLFVFSFILSPIFIFLRNNSKSKFIQLVGSLFKSKIGIFTFLIPLILILIYIRPHFPVTHNLVNDWYTFSYDLIYFFYGFLFISIGEVFWNKIKTIKKTATIIGILSFLIYLFLVYQEPEIPLLYELASIAKGLNAGCWIVVVLGYASQCLSKSGKWRAYLNQAVYPFYIVHQTIIVILAYYLYDADISGFIKFIILLVGTLGGSWLVFEIVRRNVLTRILVGIKTIPKNKNRI